MRLCGIAAIVLVRKTCTLTAIGEECEGVRDPPPSDIVLRDGEVGPRPCPSRDLSFDSINQSISISIEDGTQHKPLEESLIGG